MCVCVYGVHAHAFIWIFCFVSFWMLFYFIVFCFLGFGLCFKNLKLGGWEQGDDLEGFGGEEECEYI